MSQSPQDNDSGNGPNLIVLIVVLITFSIGFAWLLGNLRSAGDALTCLASGRHNCDRIQQ